MDTDLRTAPATAPADAPDAAAFYAEARHDLPGPLHGVRVLDVTKVWSGPVASCVLADLGADVLRVEMPGNREGLMPPEIPGTGLSWFRQSVHRNKRSIGLDLRRPGAAEVFLRLVATADVVVENYKPGTLDAWGVGYRACRAVRPDVVMVSISGYGQYGPDAGRPGYDPTTQAAAGWMALNGEPDGAPLKAPTFLADDLAGLHAVIGALAALRHRDRTGEGQHVDVSMLDSLLFSSNGYLTLGATGVPLRRWGDQADFVVPAGCFRCADGHVYVAVALDRSWRRLAEVIGRPELARAPGYATNEERRDNRAAVNAVLAGWCADRTCAEVVAALDANGITAERVRTFAEAAADPQVRARAMVQETVLANGTTAPLTGPAVKFSRTPTAVRTGAPEPGADTERILDELGVDAPTRARLRADRAIG
ncbi:CaiB/BaiF CoA transferase family protein [Micromonospora globbae]|uniref:CaiB/BaiF CoA transferase family protein n=1 Tax=Micromonospora globbae TaxID=1894969 RepID=UPI00386C9DDF|nr:CoA transferase [Micromonospora globbae]